MTTMGRASIMIRRMHRRHLTRTVKRTVLVIGIFDSLKFSTRKMRGDGGANTHASPDLVLTLTVSLSRTESSDSMKLTLLFRMHGSRTRNYGSVKCGKIFLQCPLSPFIPKTS